jgi:hypothetical protein
MGDPIWYLWTSPMVKSKNHVKIIRKWLYAGKDGFCAEMFTLRESREYCMVFDLTPTASAFQRARNSKLWLRPWTSWSYSILGFCNDRVNCEVDLHVRFNAALRLLCPGVAPP